MEALIHGIEDSKVLGLRDELALTLLNRDELLYDFGQLVEVQACFEHPVWTGLDEVMQEHDDPWLKALIELAGSSDSGFSPTHLLQATPQGRMQ